MTRRSDLQVKLMERLGQAAAEPSVPAEAPERSVPAPFSSVKEAAHGVKVTLERQVRDLQTELSALREGGAEQLLDANLIDRSVWCNRHAAAFADAKFEQLRADIRLKGGNQQAILVRPIPERNGRRFEIAYGHRRHAACMAEGLPVKALVRELTDEQLVDFMEWENRDRDDLSSYERGLSYQRMLSEKLFRTAEELALAKGITPGLVSQLLAYAAIPTGVMSVFSDPRQLTIKQAAALRAVCKADLKAVELRAAGIMADDSPKGHLERFRVLMGEGPTAKPVEIKVGNRAVMWVQKTQRGQALQVAGELTKGQLREIAELVAKWQQQKV